MKFLGKIRNLVYKIATKFELYDNLKGVANQAEHVNIDDTSYDLVISSSDPKSSHLFVYKLFEIGVLKNTKWKQIWGDPFYSDITSTKKWNKGKIKKEERKLLNYASSVIYVSPLTLESQKSIFPEYSDKMKFVPIPYNARVEYPVVNETEKLSLLYSGDYMSSVRDIRPLYDAICDSNDAITICGGSDINLKPLSNVKIYPRISVDEVKKLEENADVLIHLSNKSGSQIPGKIYQFSGTNKYVLFILDGDSQKLSDFFSKYNRFIFCENNKESISRALSQIKKDNYKNTRFIIEDFSPKEVSKTLINS
ncbi:hypothetical protein DX130_25535 [Paenibacillus paeoniae]|uniref:Glycosyltransferase family 1 protein n=1 Tax=Paenibacillus paeoniae TaxID=2292705 RepID=A0A371P023_9BACL|nr:hypothetical protein DX130_25535 [Paenibacillus paeoniae]